MRSGQGVIELCALNLTQQQRGKTEESDLHLDLFAVSSTNVTRAYKWWENVAGKGVRRYDTTLLTPTLSQLTKQAGKDKR